MEELVELIFDLIAPIVDAFLESLRVDWPGRTIPVHDLEPLEQDHITH